MIIKREKYFTKKINRIGDFCYDTQYIKQTSFWLFGIIPLYIKNEVQKGRYENK
jgi:hypothetical protein